MKCAHRLFVWCSQAYMASRIRDALDVLALVQPDLGIGFAESDGRFALDELFVAEWRQHGFVEARGCRKIADGYGYMVDHRRSSSAIDHSLAKRGPAITTKAKDVSVFRPCTVCDLRFGLQRA